MDASLPGFESQVVRWSVGAGSGAAERRGLRWNLKSWSYDVAQAENAPPQFWRS
mgnify:CR=1 FL=1